MIILCYADNPIASHWHGADKGTANDMGESRESERIGEEKHKETEQETED